MRGILFFLYIFLSIPAFCPAAAKESGTIRLAFTENVFSKADRNDASSALKAWASAVVQERNINDRVEIIMLGSVQELQKKLDDEEVDGATLTTGEMIKLRVIPEFVYLPIVNNKPEVNYVILVNKKRAQHLDQLRSGRILIFEGQRMSLARLWFTGLVIEECDMSGEQLDTFDLVEEKDISNAIFKVFFQQADAAIVTADAFKLAVELNPQLGRDLQILHQSEPLVPGVFIFRSNWTGRSADVLDAALTQLHTTPGGQQVLTVFQSSSMEKFPVETITPTLEFVKARQQIMDCAKERP